ncbi:1-acyl-sn-glycerol-3-phosphate acyltransferase [Aurantimonas sp. VKM B-3413]|uniref:lysophospholipid acyltransferase family protein n=1 Tax=Aurantimonas sp. VKM B-3413 TaxID=2779401 RepID=UPI001E512B21|nr:lysophospholipid acyltransferase family protein [Aurantimonas sp. VKM B-3413]MCB8836346.1 1-acyl-sn-glycerol-3-phosphate acyltransferase [Aurantimonas sp. VKM B-3413]
MFLRQVLLALTRFLIGGHGRWIGVQPTLDQRIYFANHGSHLDTIVMWAALPAPLRTMTSPVAAADYWGKTRLRRYIALEILGCVLIDRKRSGESDPLAPVRASLIEGRSLILFPEGTRGNEPLPGPFKSGLFHLAEAFPRVELVPVFLDNLSRAFPKGAILPAPISCTARFGAPLRPGPGETKSDFLERARRAVCVLSEPAGSER